MAFCHGYTKIAVTRAAAAVVAAATGGTRAPAGAERRMHSGFCSRPREAPAVTAAADLKGTMRSARGAKAAQYAVSAAAVYFPSAKAAAAAMAVRRRNARFCDTHREAATTRVAADETAKSKFSRGARAAQTAVSASAASAASATAAAAGGATAAAAAAAATLPDSAVMGLVCLCAALAQAAESHTRWGKRASAVVVAMLAGAALSAAGVLPPTSTVYDFVWTYVMPLAVALTLLQTDISRAFADAGLSTAAFLLGAVCTVFGTVAAFALVGPNMGPLGWKVAACFCASYVGGSVNFAATAQALGLGKGAAGPGILSAGMAVDNVLMALFFGVLALIPDKWPAARSAPRDSCLDASGHEAQNGLHGKATNTTTTTTSSSSNSSSTSSSSQHRAGQPSILLPTAEAIEVVEGSTALTVERIVTNLAAATMACGLAELLVKNLLPPPMAGCQVAFAALIASLMPTLHSALQGVERRLVHARRNQLVSTGRSVDGSDSDENKIDGTRDELGIQLKRPADSSTHVETLQPPSPSPAASVSCFQGSDVLGGALMLIFFATIGATANIGAAVAAGGPLFAFVSVLLLVHLLLLLLLGRFANLPLNTLLVASNANVGGPATAAAMAASRSWHHLVQPAVVTGTLGYAIGTAVGLVVAVHCLRPMAHAFFGVA